MLAACGGDGGPDPETPPAPAPTAIGGVTQIAPVNEAWLSSTRTVVALPKATIDAANVSRGWAALSGPARCDVTVQPAYASLLPPPDASRAALSDYHQGAAPAPCFAIVRDRLLERYR